MRTLKDIIEKEIAEPHEFIQNVNFFVSHIVSFLSSNGSKDVRAKIRTVLPLQETKLSLIMEYLLRAKLDADRYLDMLNRRDSQKALSYYNLPPGAAKYMLIGANALSFFPLCVCKYIEN